MLTDKGDFVVDPFGGSCVTGEVAERLKRKWMCSELLEDYAKGAIGRFERPLPADTQETFFPTNAKSDEISYKLCHPASMWSDDEGDSLPADGGKNRPLRKINSNAEKSTRRSRNASNQP
jgi:site-specific DNA-methyltransferase (cytosine-N4-specific)